MHVKLAIIALCIYGLSIVGLVIGGTSSGPFIEAKPAAVPTTSPVVLPDPLVGFTLNFHHTRDLSLYLKAVDEIAALGFNSVQVVTPAFQEHGASQTIHIEYGPGMSPTREDLVELLHYAHSKGLSTSLMPIVLFSRPRGNEWRGKIQPEKWSPWWNSYQRMLDYYVDIALECDVQMLSVGSELLTTETNFEAWQRLIQRVRSKYKGKLIYSTNWDHYHVPTFWGELDYIGISGYWDVTTLARDRNRPDPDELARRWAAIRQRMLTFSSEKNRPVVITEIGYPSLPWALKNPWNYVAGSRDVRPDVQMQAMGYRAFLAAWEDLLVKPSQRVTPTTQVDVDPREIEPATQGTTQAATQAMTQPGSQAQTGAQAASRPLSQPAGIDPTVAASNPQTAPAPATPTSPSPDRSHGLLGFYFYAWDVYYQGGPNDTGYGVRGKPAHQVLERFMEEHGFIKAYEAKFTRPVHGVRPWEGDDTSPEPGQ